MARKKSADVVTEVEVPAEPEEVLAEPVVTDAEVATEPPEVHECVFSLFFNDHVVYASEEGKSPSVEGTWRVLFVDPSSPNTCFGPYIMYNRDGLPFIGRVDLPVLKRCARWMWTQNLSSFEHSPSPLLSIGNKLMSGLIYTDI